MSYYNLFVCGHCNVVHAFAWSDRGEKKCYVCGCEDFTNVRLSDIRGP